MKHATGGAAAAILSAAFISCASCSSPTGMDQSAPRARSSSSTTTTTSPATTSPLHAAPEPATPSPTDQAACTFEGGFARQERPPGPAKRYLVDVRVDSDGCTDRVTFSFEPSADGVSPGFSVEYQDGPFRDSSDRAIDVAGSAFLVVWVRPAAIAHFEPSGEVVETYQGPDILDARGATVGVQQVGLFSAFEGNLRFVIALDGIRPFRLHLGNANLVVEIGSPEDAVDSPPGAVT